MNSSEKALIIKKFSSYYETAELNIPNTEQREFGFGNIKKIDSRHLSFDSRDALRHYLMRSTPLFLSHSVSYYRFPGATPMEKKGWLGADLVFDFDAHSETKYGVYAPEMLGKMKEDAMRLCEDFLKGDFGISKKDIKMVFSGNRGYHVHVHDANYFDLTGDDRKEIVDYIRGVGLNHENFFIPDGMTKGKYHGPKLADSGYRGRFVRETIKLVETQASKLSRTFTDEKKKNDFIGALKEGNWNKSSLKHEELVSRLALVAKSLPVTSIDADAGVSYDISKLIRAPNSLHGDTGLVAKVISDIDKFEPLRDALLPGKETIKVKFTQDAKIDGLGNTSYDFKKDDVAQLGEWVAAFFVLRNSANIM